MSEEICARCGEMGDDRRTLRMDCGYAMAELRIPLVEERAGYTMRVCKECRADWMRAIQAWYNGFEKRVPLGSNIFVRDFGAPIEVTLEEFQRRRKRAEQDVNNWAKGI